MVRIVAFALTVILFNGSIAFSQTELQGNETFQKIRLLVPAGDKLKATKVILRFEPDRMVMRSSNGADLKIVLYSAIKSAEYTFSNGPRYKASPGVILLANVFAIPLFVTNVERHRLAVQSDRDYVILDLDKDNYKVLLSAFEANTGKKVATAEAGELGILRSGLISSR